MNRWIEPTPPVPWHTPHPLTANDAAGIVAADLPEFDGAQVAALGSGWDFMTFSFNDEWVFRFPKRRQCARQLARERALLASLHRSLAQQRIAIPQYRYFVETPAQFRLPYGGYPLLRGDALLDCPVEEIDAEAIGAQLGGFLSQLNAQAPLPKPRTFRDDFAGHLVDFRRQLAELSGALPAYISAACTELLAQPIAPDESPPLFQHADLGAEHILVDRGTGRISGIIDWGDAAWEHPVADLVGLWAWGGDAAVRAALPRWCGALQKTLWRRLRLRGAAYAIGTAYFGYKDRRDRLYATALGWLERMYQQGQLIDPESADE